MDKAKTEKKKEAYQIIIGKVVSISCCCEAAVEETQY